MFERLSQYHVEDLIVSKDSVKVILLLESPFSDEVIHKHPLAGSTGKNVASFFVDRISGFTDWDRKTAFGCQVLASSYPQIALMNCSNYPLDKSVYSCVDYKDNAALIDGLDLIRCSPKSQSRKDPFHTQIESYLIVLLKQRLEWVTDEQLIVPCGAVANSLLGKCDIDGLRIVEGFVPHPSRNQWTVDDNFEDVDTLIQSINLQINE